ncbi:MAG: M3 family metallopeptidase, partial [Candidatus Heimdallarchaeota archaeon]
IEKDFKSKLSPDDILNVFTALEPIYMDMYEIYGYAALTMSADQNNKDAKELMSRVQNALSTISSKLVFIDLELGILLKSKPELIQKPEFSQYKHYLEKVLRKVPYQLSESEEQLIIEKNLYGIVEWSKLKSQRLATQKFKLNIDGEEKEVSWSTGYKYFSSQNHNHRLEAVKKILGGLGEDKEFYGTALRALCGNYVLEAKRRKYSILESSCIANDIEEDMVSNMFSAIEKNLGMFQEFLRYKAKLYGTEKLRGEDLDGPYPIQTGDESVSWDEAKDMVFESFNSFDSEIGSFIKDMYDKNRIDSLQKPAKVSGAFCMSWSKGKSAFVLQSFNNNIDSVSTLAHELGHGIHAYLATR